MKNLVQDGKTMSFVVVDKPVKSGEIVVVGDMAGIAITAGNIGDMITLSIDGVFALPKGAEALEQGKKAYVNVTDGVATIVGTATGNKFTGYVWRKATAGDPTVDVKLSI